MADRRTSEVPTPSSLAPEDFEAFYAKWVIEQQRFLEQLIAMSNQNDYVCQKEEELVKEVMWHYMSYYEEKEKAMACNELCFLLFSPPWQSSLERVILWMGGFKPSFALNLLESSVKDLSPEQRRRLELVRVEVEEEERAVEEVAERVYEGVLAGRDNRDVGVKEELKAAVMGRADKVRREAMTKAVASLSGPQTVKFLVAVGSYHLGLRNLGLNFPLM